MGNPIKRGGNDENTQLHATHCADKSVHSQTNTQREEGAGDLARWVNSCIAYIRNILCVKKM